MQQTTLKVHFLYIVGILTAIIIVLLTARIGALDVLTSYINFGVGLTSIVLSLLAIIYAYLSNDAFSRQVVRLDDAAGQVTSAAKNAVAAMDALQQNIEAVPNLILDVEKKVSRTQSVLEDFLSRSHGSPTHAQASSESLEKFSGRASPRGVLTTYAAIKAHNLGTGIDLEALSTGNRVLESDYGQGWIMALNAASILDTDATKPAWLVTYVHPELEALVDDAFERVVKEAPRRAWAEDLTVAKAQIDAFFDQSTNVAQVEPASRAQ